MFSNTSDYTLSGAVLINLSLYLSGYFGRLRCMTAPFWVGRFSCVPIRWTPDISRIIEVELGLCPPWQNIFYYDRQGSLRGMDFVDAEARLNLNFEMYSSNLREVRLRVVPELEEPPGPPKWQKDAAGDYHQVPQKHRH